MVWDCRWSVKEMRNRDAFYYNVASAVPHMATKIMSATYYAPAQGALSDDAV